MFREKKLYIVKDEHLPDGFFVQETISNLR